MLDPQGKILLDIKNHLKASNGTNSVLTQKDWKNPMGFSLVANKDERMISIPDGTSAIRQIRVKLWQTDPPVEFADSDRRHTNDLVVLQKKLLALNIHCTEIRRAPMSKTFGFYLDPKDFDRARTAAIKIIGKNSLTATLELDTRSNGVEDWKDGKKAGERRF